MSEKIVGDPNSFAGASEHSHQVALMAAVAQYVEYFRKQFLDESRSMVERSEAQRKCNALEWFHAVPNGGSRGSDKRSAMIAGANMKSEGVKTGVYDLCLPVARCGYHSFYIEMKKPGTIRRAPDGSVMVGRDGKLMDGRSDEQVRFGDWIASEGSLGAVFDSWGEALKALMWYLGFEHSLLWELS